jgi:hypothetical protein
VHEINLKQTPTQPQKVLPASCHALSFLLFSEAPSFSLEVLDLTLTTYFVFLIAEALRILLEVSVFQICPLRSGSEGI